jgi:hypothetical protein
LTKQIYEGFIAKSLAQQAIFEWDDCEDNEFNYGAHFLIFNGDLEIYDQKGKTDNWLKENPPVRIRITVETGDAYKADFLWPGDKDSIEEAGYEFANARTEGYQKLWWDILIRRIKEKNESKSN